MAHYATEELHTVEELRELFPLGEADALNWLFVGTSGVHGSYQDIEGLEADAAKGETDLHVTVLVVQPRLVCCKYGHLAVAPGDFTFLRGLVRSTVASVAKSQAGSL